jgi:hypothetical protein
VEERFVWGRSARIAGGLERKLVSPLGGLGRKKQ